MDEEKLSVEGVQEALKEGAKKARQQKDIFDSIIPDANYQNQGRRITDLYTDDQALQSDEILSRHFQDPIVIRDDPSYRQYLQYKKKPTKADQDVIEYLEKYVGRIFYYYKSNHDLENSLHSDIIIQSNFVPFSPFRRYTIPSGVPVAVPRWIILFLKQQCQNNIVQFQKRPEDAILAEMHSKKPMVEVEELVIKKGESLIKILELPKAPKRLVG